MRIAAQVCMDDGIVVVPKETGSMKESLADLGRKVDDLGRGLRAEIRALKEETGAQDETTRAEIRRLRVELLTHADAKFEEARREARVLHEDALARIADLAPDFGPIRREFQAADDDLRESIDRRLTPLEAAERARRKR